MKIVVLDGYTLNPGDLSWDGLKEFGEVVIYERTGRDDIIERAMNATALFTNKTPLDAATLSRLSSLKYIGVMATGYNIVDIHAASQRGILVTNAPAYGTASVVQMTFALLLELCHHTQKHSDSVFEGNWVRSPDFSYNDFPLKELSGKRLGIIGYGDIGQKVGHVAAAFGMEILVNTRHPQKLLAKEALRSVELPELLAESDVVSIHCPLNAQTQGMINKQTLKCMKHSAFLINTARGPIIVEADLADALNLETIAGAGLDVLSMEPPRPDNPLFKSRNCIITPHISWATQEARSRLMRIVSHNFSAFLKGQPVNVVYP